MFILKSLRQIGLQRGTKNVTYDRTTRGHWQWGKQGGIHFLQEEKVRVSASHHICKYHTYNKIQRVSQKWFVQWSGSI